MVKYRRRAKRRSMVSSLVLGARRFGVIVVPRANLLSARQFGDSREDGTDSKSHVYFV